MNEPNLKIFSLPSGLEIPYLGPDPSHGPLPAIFYFALSAQDSLCLDPYNQPAVFLSQMPVRIFSMTLPGHGLDLPHTRAIEYWAQQITQNHNFIEAFIEQVSLSIDGLINQGMAIPHQMGAMGLSRGGFVALHAAARIPHFRAIVNFAPVTQLSVLKEFKDLKTALLVEQLNVEYFVNALIDRKVRCYIGNRDTRVGTRHCFDFIEKLTESAFNQRIRSPSAELFISPSIGLDGHGTAQALFHDGAKWLVNNLKVSHES